MEEAAFVESVLSSAQNLQVKAILRDSTQQWEEKVSPTRVRIQQEVSADVCVSEVVEDEAPANNQQPLSLLK